MKTSIFLEEVRGCMLRTLKIASAFIGIIVGAGFASGQEILQYFTSFGYVGTIGAIVSTALFAYVGMMLVTIGSRLKTTNHKDAIFELSGKYIGRVVDYVIIFTLFGVGVVMIAGAGSLLNQQFGLPTFVGSLIIVVLIAGSVMLNVQQVVAVIGSITPFLVLFILMVGLYSLFTIGLSFNELEPLALKQESALPNWLFAAVNYVSFNTAVGAAMSLVMGGAEEDPKVAARGGLIGGLGLGILIVISHLAIFSKVDVVAGYELPMLKIVDTISPILAIVMTFVMFGMIFNTGVSMFYAFTSRFIKINTKKANIFVSVTLVIGFIASFVGFTGLVSFFYPLIGTLGLVLIGVLIYAPIKLAKHKNSYLSDELHKMSK